MRIRRIDVQNFRKLVDRVVIDDIADGVTVIAGDNEDGKSTVLQALRTVLFDRHTLTGADAEAMQPFGHKVRPEIGLDFEIDGALYCLRKGFCQRHSAELKTPTGTFAGMEVEEKLQELLRFRAPGRGASRADEHHGICGLFWVEQGRSFAPISLNADNRGVLAGALEGEVGEVLGGTRGRALKETIARHYFEFFTKTGKETGTLAAASRNVGEFASRLLPLKEQLREYHAKVDELAKTRGRLADYKNAGMLAKAQTAFGQAEAHMKDVNALRHGVSEAQTAKAIADAGVQGPAAALGQRGEAVARAVRDVKAFEDAKIEAELAEREFASCTSAFEVAAANLSESETKWETTERILRAVERQQTRRGVEEEIRRLARILTDARAAEELARAARARVALAKVDATVLRQLRNLEEKRVHAEAALAGSETLVRFQLERDGLVQIGGAAVPREGEISIAEPCVIQIADVGSLVIIPGGSELPERRKAADKTARQLHEALLKIGASSIAQADTIREQCQRDRQEAENRTNIVAALAPEGIDALASRLAEAEAGLARLQAEPENSVEMSLEEARAIHRAASEETTRLRRQHELAQSALGKAREERARAQAKHESAGNAAAESIAELKSARDNVSDDALRAAHAEAGRRAALASSVLDAAESALRAAEPEVCQLKLEQTRDALANIGKDIDALERAAERVAIELQAAGQRGLGEEVEELEGQLALAVAKQKSVSNEAASLRLLYETICRAEKVAREAFLAPVQACVRPYLRLLMPDAELVLSDDDLGVTHLRRSGQDEPYGALSIGAREQIAVLTRLAFADLLRERGITAPVILDDALVNSDPRRFESMLLAIRRAARALQIIVLTCHESSWMQSGAPVIRLAARARS
ncbi:MAG TPA: AAA family ATPase [Rhizomicrobium sp.]|jgi:hypothetical protein|nr:AAA family ATPase [Rhizomicrobium sp.]